MKKRALVSVSNKKNLLPFCQALVKLNYEIISTGGTKKFLDDNDIPTRSVADITNFSEILGGRVKTLHPNVHAGILANRENVEHLSQLKHLDINLIDMVVVNLYPFKETIAKPNISLSEAIENIDVGGPCMLRAAAKNYKFVSVVCEVEDYEKVIEEIKTQGDTTINTRQMLAYKVFKHCSAYDTMIAHYLQQQQNISNIFEQQMFGRFEKIYDLRYGENPHQKAALYKNFYAQNDSITQAHIIQGKELSYNNIQDIEAGLNIINEFDTNENVCVAIKHSNPCGVSAAENILQAWKKTLDADPISIFGGIIVFNQVINEQVASELKEIFLEVIVAPAFSDSALQILSVKKNLRLVTLDVKRKKVDSNLQFKTLHGGLLVQEKDIATFDTKNINVVTTLIPTDEELKNLAFAWKVVKHVKSNAIVIAQQQQTLGIGMGQTSRIGAAQIALAQIKNTNTQNLVLASDAFFPFDDVVRLAHQYNIKSIIQPGGSVRDKDSIDTCNQLKISMVFTSIRHFTH